MTDDVRVIDRASATKLLTDLRQCRWSWRREDLPEIATWLGWTNFEIVAGKYGEVAFADAPVSFGGEEVEARIGDGEVKTILIQVSDQPDKKTNESLISLHRSWTELIALATELFGPPTRRTGRDNPDAQWRGEQATLSIQNVKSALVINWAGNAYQDHWNNLRRAPDDE
jgi:Family of unknown function (DUF6301)